MTLAELWDERDRWKAAVDEIQAKDIRPAADAAERHGWDRVRPGDGCVPFLIDVADRYKVALERASAAKTFGEAIVIMSDALAENRGSAS